MNAVDKCTYLNFYYLALIYKVLNNLHSEVTGVKNVKMGFKHYGDKCL